MVTIFGDYIINSIVYKLTSKEEDGKIFVSNFALKPKESSNRGIYEPVDGWSVVLGSNGGYVND